MARIYYNNEVVNRISGKLEGSVFRKQGNINILQNKRYRNVAGFPAIGRQLANSDEPRGMVNQLYPHAVQYIARNGFPFEYSDNDILEYLDFWGWQYSTNPTPMFQLKAIFLAICWYFDKDPGSFMPQQVGIFPIDNNQITVFTYMGYLGINIYNDDGDPYSKIMMSASAIVKGVNHSQKGRYVLRTEIPQSDLNNYDFVFPPGYPGLENLPYCSLYITLQAWQVPAGSGLGPSTPPLFFVPEIV